MKHKIAVLIPCFNESKTIKKVVEDFRRVLPEAVIYVYDNNSNDGTGRIAKECGALVRHESRQGKGNVIRTMFREIFADCYVLVDGDNTYSAESAQEMVRLVIEESADMVIGDRLSSTYFTENKRPFHNTGNVLVRRLVNAFFKGSITDIMTGYRALSINFVKTFPILSGGFEIETEMTIHALDKNLLVKSLPVLYRDRPAGSASKLNTIADGTKILILIFNLFRCYKPLCFFRRCGVNTGFAGGGVFYTRFCRLCQNGPGSQVSDIYRKRDSGDIFTSVLCLRSHSGFHRKD